MITEPMSNYNRFIATFAVVVGSHTIINNLYSEEEFSKIYISLLIVTRIEEFFDDEKEKLIWDHSRSLGKILDKMMRDLSYDGYL